MSTETSKIKTAFMIFVCIIMQSTVYGIMPFQNIYKRNLASDTIIDTAQDKPAINPTHKIALSFSKQIFKPLFLNDDTSTLEGLVGTDLSNFFDLDSTISSYLNSDSSPIDQYDDISEPSYDGLSDAIRQKIRNLIGATSAIKENAYATNVYYDRDRLCLIFDVYVKIIMDRRININSSKILCDFKGPIVSNNIELTFRLEYSLYFYL